MRHLPRESATTRLLLNVDPAWLDPQTHLLADLFGAFTGKPSPRWPSDLRRGDRAELTQKLAAARRRAKARTTQLKARRAALGIRGSVLDRKEVTRRG